MRLASMAQSEAAAFFEDNMKRCQRPISHLGEFSPNLIAPLSVQVAQLFYQLGFLIEIQSMFDQDRIRRREQM